MLIFKGILIGVSTVVPGLSGGTLAVILKLYDRLISSVRFFSFSKKDKYKHLFFLGQVFLGCLIGVVAFSHLMEYLLRARSIQTHFFFLGLVLGSFPSLVNSFSESKLSFKAALSFILSFSGIIFFVLFTANLSNLFSNSINFWFLMLSGFLAAGSLIVPGISGSLVLLILGSYNSIIKAVSSFDYYILSTVFLGAILGVLVFSYIMDYCLKHFAVVTHFIILGLVLGSIVKLWPGFHFSLVNVLVFSVGVFLGSRLG